MKNDHNIREPPLLPSAVKNKKINMVIFSFKRTLKGYDDKYCVKVV